MKLKIHHVNFSTENVARLDAFYREIMDLKPEPQMNANRITTQGYPGKAAFLSDGETQLHVAERDLEICYRTKQGVNPLDRGHIAFRTDDITAFKRRLTAKGIPFADFGAWAMAGWQQIFFYDPDGNVVEVHQVDAGAQS